MKKRRPIEETPLARFVRVRLAEMGMKQSEFCRLTGFDQGLLSKIQSSMISSLNLETALRLAVGLSVRPESILSLMGKTELHGLILKAYPHIDEASIPERSVEEIPAPVLEINRLALNAHSMGRDLAPVVDLLSKLASVNGGRAEASSANEMHNGS